MRASLLTRYSLTSAEIAEIIGSTTDSLVQNPIIISGITLDSEAVIPGDLFVALPGLKTHGAKYIEAAVKNGAVALLTDQGAECIAAVPIFRVENPRFWVGILSDKFYDNPTNSMDVIGITGTNGKTTTSYLLQQIWDYNKRFSGLIGTIEIRVGEESFSTTRTTPEAPELQSIFAVMRERHCQNAVIEVSSHALTLGRVNGVKFTVVGFTNLSHDHLDFHGSMEEYFKAKSRLFKYGTAQKAVINIDDVWGKKLAGEVEFDAITISARGESANWKIIERHSSVKGMHLVIQGVDGILLSIDTPLIGDYNSANVLMALALAVESGVDPLAAAEALSNAKGAPGRMESIANGQEFTALVDYAHTPDAVSAVLGAVRSSIGGKIIAVLGCGGDRDASKRALMGSALVNGADIAIFTSDNPRSEDPLAILNQMNSHLPLSENHHSVVDRRAAINLAVSLATPQDCVIILGKGHETGQEVNGKLLTFSDRDELQKAIELKQ